jgi:hypothetical protein
MSPAQYRAGNLLRVPACGVWRAVPRGRPTSRLARGLAARSSRVCGLRARPQSGHRVGDDTVAGLPSVRRWLAGSKVHPEGTSEAAG